MRNSHTQYRKSYIQVCRAYVCIKFICNFNGLITIIPQYESKPTHILNINLQSATWVDKKTKELKTQTQATNQCWICNLYRDLKIRLVGSHRPPMHKILTVLPPRDGFRKKKSIVVNGDCKIGFDFCQCNHYHSLHFFKSINVHWFLCVWLFEANICRFFSASSSFVLLRRKFQLKCVNNEYEAKKQTVVGFWKYDTAKIITSSQIRAFHHVFFLLFFTIQPIGINWSLMLYNYVKMNADRRRKIEYTAWAVNIQSLVIESVLRLCSIIIMSLK